MIVPLTDDAVWMECLDGLPPLELPATEVVVVAPHPDDETLGAGALIATLRSRGVGVTVVAVTDGENAYDAPPDEREQLGRTREREQQKALADLGVEAGAIRRLRLVDSGLHTAEMELTAKLLEIVTPNVTLIAPWSGDFHPDHECCARAAAAAAGARGAPRLSYFFWTWHRAAPALVAALPLRCLRPAPAALAAKVRAVARHRSQLQRATGDPILPRGLLGPAHWPFEVFLPQ